MPLTKFQIYPFATLSPVVAKFATRVASFLILFLFLYFLDGGIDVCFQFAFQAFG